ncbi:DUF2510 domain-containing protein [Cellulomonas sp. P5_C6]
MTTAPPGWYPSPDASGADRWWDGAQWTGHVRPTVADAPAPQAATPVVSQYAAAFEATNTVPQRGGIASAIGGLGQQYLPVAVATSPQPGSTFVPQPHAPTDSPPYGAAQQPDVSESLRPAGAATPQPYGYTSPAPYVSPTPQPYGAAEPQPYGYKAPQPYGTPGPQPYGTAAPQPYGTAAPQPYPPAGVQPYGAGGVSFGAFGSPQAQGLADVVGGVVGNQRGGGVANGLKAIGIGLVFVLVSVFFLVPEIMSARAGAGEASTSGTVVDLHESRDTDGTRMCSPEVSFVVAGSSYRARAHYSSSSCPSVGSSIGVVYTTADPSDARVPESVGILMLLALFPVVGVVLVVVGIRQAVTGSSSILSGVRRLRP